MKIHLPVVDAEMARPGDLIGFRKHGQPIYLAAGGSEDADDADDGDEDEDDSDDESGDKDESKQTDADLKAELERVKKALNKANRDAARHRRKAAEAGNKKDDPGTEAKIKEMETKLARLDAAESLRDAGAQGTKDKVLKMVNMLNSIEPDDIQDAIDDLKEEFPEFFKEPEKGDRKPRVRKQSTSEGTDKGDKKQGGLSEDSARMLKAHGFRV